MDVLKNVHVPSLLTSNCYSGIIFKPQDALQITFTSILYLHPILKPVFPAEIKTTPQKLKAHINIKKHMTNDPFFSNCFVFRMCIRTNQYLYPVIPMTGACLVFR